MVVVVVVVVLLMMIAHWHMSRLLSGLLDFSVDLMERKFLQFCGRQDLHGGDFMGPSYIVLIRIPALRLLWFSPFGAASADKRLEVSVPVLVKLKFSVRNCFNSLE